MSYMVAYILICSFGYPSDCDSHNARAVVLGVPADPLTCAGLGNQNQQLVARAQGLELSPGEYWKMTCEPRSALQ